jgi:hypothetical protein
MAKKRLDKLVSVCIKYYVYDMSQNAMLITHKDSKRYISFSLQRRRFV